MNQSIRAIVVDDDERSRNAIKMLIEEHLGKVEVVGTAADQAEACRLITGKKPDLVYMDIQLQEGDCFSIFKEFDTIDFEVIFITAHDEFALQAIRFSALDFILKPVDPEELIEATSKYYNKKLRDSNKRLNNLRENLEGKKSNKIALPSQTDIQFVEVDSIVRIEAEKNYSVFHIDSKRPVTVSRTLKEYEEMLTGFNFFRVHQSHLININRVERYLKGRGGYVVMSDGASLEVSVRKKEEFLAVLKGRFI